MHQGAAGLDRFAVPLLEGENVACRSVALVAPDRLAQFGDHVGARHARMQYAQVLLVGLLRSLVGCAARQRCQHPQACNQQKSRSYGKTRGAGHLIPRMGVKPVVGRGL